MPHSITFTTDFPGGNALIERQDGDTVWLRQDLRDTAADWFYWAFRVQHAQGRRLTFHFTGSEVLTARGPAFSRDAGATWQWLGTTALAGNGFTFDFGPDDCDIRFALAPAYGLAHWQAFIPQLASHPACRLITLCRTRQNREIPALFIDGASGQPPVVRLLLTCRHHACESLANYALEGFLVEYLQARHLAPPSALLALPFIDLDGVENGDQGKNRTPHDHWEDYGVAPLYEATAALKATVPAWCGGRLTIALDLHCPMHRGPGNEDILLVAGAGDASARAVAAFAARLEQLQSGPLRYGAGHALPYGQGWNVDRPPLQRCDSWAVRELAADLAVTVEIPYAVANGVTVTATAAHAFGRDLARTVNAGLCPAHRWPS